MFPKKSTEDFRIILQRVGLRIDEIELTRILNDPNSILSLTTLIWRLFRPEVEEDPSNDFVSFEEAAKEISNVLGIGVSATALRSPGEVCLGELSKIGMFLGECVTAAERVMGDSSVLSETFNNPRGVPGEGLEKRLSSLVDSLGEINDIQTRESVDAFIKSGRDPEHLNSLLSRGEEEILRLVQEMQGFVTQASSLDLEMASKRSELGRLSQRLDDLRERMKPLVEDQGEDDEEHKNLFEDYVTKYQNLEFLKYEIERLRL